MNYSSPACFKRWIRLLELLLLMFAVLAGGRLSAQEIGASNRILILHDSADLGIWRDQFDGAFRDHIAENSSPDQPLRVSVQYSGIDLYPVEEPRALINLLQDQHRIDPASLVVAVLPSSIQFMETYGDQIYPGVPKLYMFPDNTQAESIISDGRNVIISSQIPEISVKNTLDLIGRMNPGLRELFVFSGPTNYGPFQRQQVIDHVDEYLPGVEVRYFTGLPMRELVSAVGDPSDQTVGYLLSYQEDSEGNLFTTLDVLNELTNKTDLPIFGSFDSLFGQGIVGGNMEFATTRGTDAARVALSVLEGRNVPTIASTPQYRFDARALDRYGFDRTLLPPDSVIEFDTFSLWDEYKSELAAGIILVGIQSILIALLLMSLRRRRAAERVSARHVQDLAVQKKLFESVINSIPDAILITHADRTIYAANKSSQDVFGLDTGDLVGKSMMELIEFRNEEERLAEHAMFQSREAALSPIILQFKKANGKIFSGETLGTKIISSDGEVLGYFSLVRDVTKRLYDDQQQQRSQKMEALGNLVGGIAHDFNNVLGVITAYAEINSLTETSRQNQSNLDKIVSATQRGAELCQQILTFSKDMSVEKSAIDLSEVAEETFELLRASVASRIQLSMDRKGKSFPVFANSTQMQQVIMNLATNASHALDEQEEAYIRISLSRENVTENTYVSDGILEPGQYVLLKVADNGCGIPADKISQVFEPFYTTREGEGTGIGLAVVYKIVRAHQGIMNLRSEVGKGTEFEIYLKEFEGDSSAAKKQKGEKLVRGRGEKILLVDDEEELVASLSQLLSTIGYDVKSFTDSNAALHYFRDNPDTIDLLISDQVMPGLEGTTLLQRIREIRNDLPAIICTGHSELLEDDMHGDVQIQSVLRKPFTASEVSRNIGDILAIRH